MLRVGILLPIVCNKSAFMLIKHRVSDAISVNQRDGKTNKLLLTNDLAVAVGARRVRN